MSSVANPSQARDSKREYTIVMFQITGKRCHAASVELPKAKQFCDIQTSHATTAAIPLMYSGEPIILSCVTKYRQKATPYSKVIVMHILNSESQNSWQVYFCVH